MNVECLQVKKFPTASSLREGWIDSDDDLLLEI